jgi:hypothetical protein
MIHPTSVKPPATAKFRNANACSDVLLALANTGKTEVMTYPSRAGNSAGRQHVWPASISACSKADEPTRYSFSWSMTVHVTALPTTVQATRAAAAAVHHDSSSPPASRIAGTA